MAAGPHERGISLLELTIAMGLVLALTASLFSIMHPAGGLWAAAPEAADVQQRIRVAVDAVSKDLMRAGSGAFIGERAGPLLQYFAPLRPLRVGTPNDSLTIMYVPGSAVQTTSSAAFTPYSQRLEVAAGAGCPMGQPLCGIRTGMTLLIYNEAGTSDVLAVVAVTALYAEVRNALRAAGSPRPDYPAGSKVVEAVVHTLWRKTVSAPPSDQLMRDAAPLVDHVVGLTFDYYADPEPPLLTAQGPTYGPAPPPMSVQTTGYPAGENCTFQVDAAAQTQVPRLPALSGTPALVQLTAAQLSDGPWCPDDMDTLRWDADLLRVRRIGVELRVEAALPSLRGPAGRLFANGGTSRNGRWVRDQEIEWDVSPRNLVRLQEP
jgi:hypothetical protein